ncbi:unnamed protein product [Blepharisma stoltei]|uniref:ER lumen protein retaining receptor n=1 Tax=Blepharisma stoltei TaxID=1481888 RepID=A0AAU9IWK2_9CILI|nr:unnamed protein product [Blepharisma stoltei]
MVNYKRIFNDPRKLRKLAKKPQAKYWLLVLGVLILIYFFLSNGDFSFFLTLCSTLQMLAFVAICIQVRHTTEGLSLYTFVFYSLIYSSRLSSILPFESYLPYDSSGDWFYQVVEICSLVQSVWISIKLRDSKESSNSCFYAIPCAFLALISHTTLNNFFLTDYLWTLSMYLEAIALIPLIKEMKRIDDWDNFSSHFIAARTASQILSAIFWVKSFDELNVVYHRSKINLFPGIAGYFILASQLVSCFFTGQFFFWYVKSAALGTTSVLPL